MTRHAKCCSSAVILLFAASVLALHGRVSIAQDAAAHPAAESAAAAESVVRRLHAALTEAARLPSVAERFEYLEDEVLATHDLEFIGRLTVRRQWREMTPEQQAAFMSAFARLSVMSYAARFLNVDEHSFSTNAAQALSGGRVQVASGVRRADGSIVPLEYVLQHEEGGWRIVNVIADGVSDIALKRAEYQALIDAGGFSELLASVENQISELAEGSSP